MDTVCPDLSGDAAVLFVGQGYDKFMGLTTELINQAVNQTYRLQSLAVAPTSFNVNFDFDDPLPAIQRPARPNLDPSRFELQMPAAPADPPVFVARDVVTDEAPTFDAPAPTIAFSPRPDAPDVPAPVRPNPGPQLVVPVPDDYVLPQVPTFIELNLPNAPTLQLAQFQGERPTFVEPPLNGNWSFEPQAYTSTLLDQTRAKVGAMMARGPGFDLEPIEAVLFERGRSRIDIEVRRAIDTRVNEFATRGFTEPNGILAASIDEILEGGLDRVAEHNRDVTIESYKESLANLRFAVQQGVALEQVTVNLHLEMQKLVLAAAQYLRDTEIAILNARVTVFNARIQAYQADAQVLSARIQAELAKVELFRAQLEGEKARGELNEQRVKLYTAQLTALNTLAEFYRNRVEAVKAQAELERTKIEGYKADVDAYSARWKAYGDQVGAYKAEIEAEGAKATVHKSLVDVFATQTGAWQTKTNTAFEGERLRTTQHAQLLQAWRGQLDKMLALIQGETARIGGEAQRAGALANIYQADAAIETAVSAANDRTFQLGLERARADTDVGLKSAEIRVQENVQLTQIMLQVQKTIADVLTQLAGSSMSALNFNAGVSSSKSQSRSCDTNFSWSGEIADYGS